MKLYKHLLRASILMIIGLTALLAWVQFGTAMQPKQVGGYEIWLGEYWEWNGDETVYFPWGVKWGFYPLGGREDAIKCAQTSFTALANFLKKRPAELNSLVDDGAVRRFALWTNDYSQAATKRIERPARLWHWSTSQPHDLATGFWKWEATLTKAGTCMVPGEKEAIGLLKKYNRMGPTLSRVPS